MECYRRDSKQRCAHVCPGTWRVDGSVVLVSGRRLVACHGHDVVALTLPGLSYGSAPAGLQLADAVDYIVTEIEARDLHDVMLVSHSWGGYPATGAAHRVASRLAKVIYYNAVVPARGQAMSDENEQYGQAIHQAIASTSDHTVPLPIEAIRMGLMPDESAEMQDLVFSLTLAQPGGYMTDSMDVDGVTKIGLDAAYVLGENDSSLATPGAEFAARIGLKPVMVPGSHMAMLTKPTSIAETLHALA